MELIKRLHFLTSLASSRVLLSPGYSPLTSKRSSLSLVSMLRQARKVSASLCLRSALCQRRSAPFRCLTCFSLHSHGVSLLRSLFRPRDACRFFKTSSNVSAIVDLKVIQNKKWTRPRLTWFSFHSYGVFFLRRPFRPRGVWRFFCQDKLEKSVLIQNEMASWRKIGDNWKMMLKIVEKSVGFTPSIANNCKFPCSASSLD